jgi:hypothetical protein
MQSTHHKLVPSFSVKFHKVGSPRVGLSTAHDDLMQGGHLDPDPQLVHLSHPLPCTQCLVVDRPSSPCTGAHHEQESAECGDNHQDQDGGDDQTGASLAVGVAGHLCLSEDRE